LLDYIPGNKSVLSLCLKHPVYHSSSPTAVLTQANLQAVSEGILLMERVQNLT